MAVSLPAVVIDCRAAAVEIFTTFGPLAAASSEPSILAS
jgi:hypothetical protein